MDRKTGLKLKPRKRHPSLPLPIVNKSNNKEEIKVPERQSKNLHRAKIHLKTATVPKAQIRHPSLHAAHLHKRSAKGLLLP